MDINDSFRHLHVGLPEDIRRRKAWGDFGGAVGLIDRRLDDPSLTAPERACLTAQREMILRTPVAYPYALDEAFDLLRRRVPDFPRDAFDAMIEDGRIGWIFVDGEPRVFGKAIDIGCYESQMKGGFVIVVKEGDIR